MRRPPPLRRINDRIKVRWNDNPLYVNVGRYEDGSACEVFLDTQKEGTDLRDLMGALGIVSSLALQHGVTMPELLTALRRFPERSIVAAAVAALHLSETPDPKFTAAPTVEETHDA